MVTYGKFVFIHTAGSIKKGRLENRPAGHALKAIA